MRLITYPENYRRGIRVAFALRAPPLVFIKEDTGGRLRQQPYLWECSSNTARNGQVPERLFMKNYENTVKRGISDAEKP